MYIHCSYDKTHYATILYSCSAYSCSGYSLGKTSSQKLVPIPGLLPPGYSSLSCVFQGFLPPGEILKSGVGMTFWVPKKRRGPRLLSTRVRKVRFVSTSGSGRFQNYTVRFGSVRCRWLASASYSFLLKKNTTRMSTIISPPTPLS